MDFYKEKYADKLAIKEYVELMEAAQISVLISFLENINIFITVRRTEFDVIFIDFNKLDPADQVGLVKLNIVDVFDNNYYLFINEPYSGSILNGYRTAILKTLKRIDDAKITIVKN